MIITIRGVFGIGIDDTVALKSSDGQGGPASRYTQCKIWKTKIVNEIGEIRVDAEMG